MKYAYARVSTDYQDHDRQKEILKDYDIDETVFEIISGGKDARKRPKFSYLCEKLQPGDFIYFTEMSRMGRSTKDLIDTVDDLTKKYKVSLVFIKENIKIGEAFKEDPVATLMFHIFASFAEFERKLISQRVTDGLKAAAANGRKGGRPRDDTKAKQAIELLRQGYNQRQVASYIGVTQPYISRIKKEYISLNKDKEDIYEL